MITVIKPSEGRKEHFNQKTICRCIDSFDEKYYDEETGELEEEEKGDEGQLHLCVAERFHQEYFQRVEVYMLSEDEKVIESKYQYCLETGDIGFGSVFKNSRNIIKTTDKTLHNSVKPITEKDLEGLGVINDL